MTPGAASERRILLADADAFYVAVARLEDPEGAGKAPLLLVGGSPEGRGVVTSASYEARTFGVRSGLPMARAIRLCPQAMVVPVSWRACAEKSRDIRQVLERFTPVVQQASQDEFYLDLTGTEALYHHEPLARTAARIREAVLETTRLSVSIGGGASKLVAKLAANRAKPAGVLVVDPGGEISFIRAGALGDIPSIGPRTQERLARAGLRTVDDVLQHQRAELVRRLGEREGNWLYDRVRGIDAGRVTARTEPKSISRDGTFSQDLNDDAALAHHLLARVDAATSDLRADGLMARTITVKLRDHDFTTRQASRTLSHPVSSDRVVYQVARELLDRLRRARRVPARLIGVSLSQLGNVNPAQSAPDPVETERDRRVSRLMDQVRARFGRSSLRRGG